ncbi:ADP-ribose pyrophosphatase [Methylophaga lonarensis MPL]|uniref:ADP-ribose pyrophosphatase n=1 Tax=Methylophaga lonarensis MPL TaxID=1286106 RepID=M7P046_9GAMM|nr:NUDIX domain-containing protein [Methylophaga lonarensis]EMR12831.1 ADP-ribose pyrophosphatase [Methylophaga lonarensis MPL]
MTQKKQFKIIKQTPEYQGFFSLKTVTVSHTLYQGGWSEPLSRELFERGNCVAVLLYDPLRDEVVIIEQFRVGALQLNDERAWLLEIVAGAIEPGETAADVAMREAVEEAGCEIVELIKVMDFFTSPGGTSELLTLFCGRVDTSQVGGVHGLDEEDEDIAVTALPYSEVCQLLNDGKILSAIPIIAIQWLMLNRDMLRKQWT